MENDKPILDVLNQIHATLRRIEKVLRDDAGDAAEDACPACGSYDLKDASAMGDERFVCGGCGANLKKEPV